MEDGIYRPEILLVEDDEIMRVTVSDHLRKKGWTVTVAEDGVIGMEQLKKKDFDIVICDIRLPKKNGMELLREAKETSSQAEFIMMTAHGTIGDAVEAMRLGARDYITKPFHVDELVIRVKKIIEHHVLLAKYELLKESVEERYSYQNIIGRSKKMQAIFNVIEKVSRIDTNVIILGESGTGKGLVANVIHMMSSRRDRPFVKVNCAALPGTLLESELFGHEKGAFTGAIRKKSGKFELADRGTIFFDEIGDIPPFVQAKLLRVLQEHEFERVGGEETIKVDVRLVSATKEDLENLVANGKFREDLYFRLKVISIHLPPLRERKEDIPFLVEEFLKRFNKKLKKNLTLSNEAVKCLMSYDYPGNVRELENIIERTAAMTDSDVIMPKDILHSFDKNIRIYSDKEEENLTLKELLTRIEREHLIKVLAETDGNKVEAARILGISRKNLWEKLKVYHLLK
ncbi:MAG: sigma-54-dependent Fis family transcriptional regulator [Nitrospirae bacterium]|nr:sigma-54-dependent Fis family transcriptional regulator [Nitrospirota bacterium]